MKQNIPPLDLLKDGEFRCLYGAPSSEYTIVRGQELDFINLTIYPGLNNLQAQRHHSDQPRIVRLQGTSCSGKQFHSSYTLGEHGAWVRISIEPNWIGKPLFFDDRQESKAFNQLTS
ncbi:MAG: hypothetical protein AABX11_05385 [Nanoarchaeota archaeon]